MVRRFDYTKLKIERGIPMPEKKYNSYAQKVLARLLPSMRVGDSFAIESPTQYATIKLMAKKMGYDLMMRNTGEGQYRAWRVK